MMWQDAISSVCGLWVVDGTTWDECWGIKSQMRDHNLKIYMVHGGGIIKQFPGSLISGLLLIIS